MPKPAYPTGSDLSDFVESCGLTPSPKLDLDTEAEGAREQWEAAVGWFPFLNTIGDEEIILDQSDQGWGWGFGWGAFGGFGTWRESDPQIMDFACGILSISSIVVGRRDNPVQVLEEGRDYQLLPRNAARQGWPYSYMRLTNSWTSYGIGGLQELIVTAKCGFCHQVPTDAWRAILRHAAAGCAGQLSLSVNQGSASYKAGVIEERFASGPKSGSIVSIADDWDDQWLDRVGYYARRTI